MNWGKANAASTIRYVPQSANVCTWPNGFPDRTVCAAMPAALDVPEANRSVSEAVVRHVLTPLLSAVVTLRTQVERMI
jgi:hypothetical protein